jgi:rare lipoprotein A
MLCVGGCSQKSDTLKHGYYYITEEENTLKDDGPSETPTEEDASIPVSDTAYGKASYYADRFHGKSTASGEIYDRNKLTAAHLSLPFGTMVRVTNLVNEKQITVRVNDRGPYSENRIIDLSYKAMEALDGISAGIVEVKIEVLK